MTTSSVVNPKGEIIPDPPIARLFFGSTKLVALAHFVSYSAICGETLRAGAKISGGTWMTGEPLKGLLHRRGGTFREGRPPIAFDWDPVAYSVHA